MKKTGRLIAGFLALTLAAAPAAFAAEKKDAASKTISLDPAKSVLKWTGRKVTGAHNGTIRLKSGSAVVTKGRLTGGEFTVDMTSIENEDIQDAASRAKLVGHLKSDDFFGVDKHPEAAFKVTGVKPLSGASGSGKPTHEITGDLTIKGITHPVTFPAHVKISGDKAEAKGSITVDRTKWDVRYGSGKFFQNLGDKMIHDDFSLDFHLVAK
ncbi:MAG: YceI family protein [Elusimicrobiota bacterium]